MDKELLRYLVKTHAKDRRDRRNRDRASLDAYLDIETTGLCSNLNQITIVGIYLVKGGIERLVQIVGVDITAANITRSLEGVATIFTYNGARFDLPFIKSQHKVDLDRDFKHCDLMYHCWNHNLYGGLKSVEQQLGITRNLAISGDESIRLWWRYANYNDETSLTILLEYNREDVLHLKTLKERLVCF